VKVAGKHTHICICNHTYTRARGSTRTDMETTSQLKRKVDQKQLAVLKKLLLLSFKKLYKI